MVLGDNAYFASDVEIGGGGALDPEAELVVGSHGFVGEHVHLNPCRPLVIGDEVVISRNAVLMTHSFGASLLDGYPQRFDGIRIGDRCQIGIHCSLFPGVAMGEGAILLSGSSLVTAVPAGRLYGGVPAKDLKAAARPLSPAAFVACARAQAVEFGRQLELRGFDVSVAGEPPAVCVTVRDGDAIHRLSFAPDYDEEAEQGLAEDVRVCARIRDEAWANVAPDVVAIDLSAPRIRGACGPLAAALREFLRKRGVRLHPRSWTYPGGWL